MKRAISELKKVARQLTEKLAPFQKNVENCILANDFDGAKKAIEAKQVEQTKIDTLNGVIAQLEADLKAESGDVDASLRQQNGGGGVAAEPTGEVNDPAKKKQ